MSSDPNVSLPTSSSIGFLPLYPDSPRDLEPSVHGSLPSSSHSPASSIPANVGTSYITGSGTQRGAVASTAAPDVLDHLYKGAQCAADVKALVQSAQESFRLIEDWFEGESASRHPRLVTIKKEIRGACKNYIEGIEGSVKVAEHGIAFAADIVTLLESLSEDPGADLTLFIDEMQKMVGQAHGDAKNTFDTFSAVRRTLHQIIRQLSSQAVQIKQVQNIIFLPYSWDCHCIWWFRAWNHERDQNIQQDTAATVYRMASDVDKLLTCVDKFANWWNDAESIIQSLKVHTVFVDGQRMNQLRIHTVRTRWEAFRGEYEAYKRSINTLMDLHPMDKMWKSVPWYNRILMRRSTGAY